jgi:hypothetical protein
MDLRRGFVRSRLAVFVPAVSVVALRAAMPVGVSAAETR